MFQFKITFLVFGKSIAQKGFRHSVVSNALQITSWEAITPEMLRLQERRSELTAMTAKLAPFTGVLTVIPSRGTVEYSNAVEANNTAIVSYVKSVALAALGSDIIDQSMVDTLCDPGNYGIMVGNNQRYTELLSEWGKQWSEFDSNFLKAVSVKVQSAVDLRDRYAGLDLTSAQAEIIESDVRKLAYTKSEFALKTGTLSYLNSTTPAAKTADFANFKSQIAKANKLARIVTATVENIPSKAIFNEKFRFNNSPTNEVNKKALDNAVIAYKKGEVAKYTADPTGYTFGNNFVK